MPSHPLLEVLSPPPSRPANRFDVSNVPGFTVHGSRLFEPRVTFWFPTAKGYSFGPNTDHMVTEVTDQRDLVDVSTYAQPRHLFRSLDLMVTVTPRVDFSPNARYARTDVVALVADLDIYSNRDEPCTVVHVSQPSGHTSVYGPCRPAFVELGQDGETWQLTMTSARKPDSYKGAAPVPVDIFTEVATQPIDVPQSKPAPLRLRAGKRNIRL